MSCSAMLRQLDVEDDGGEDEDGGVDFEDARRMLGLIGECVS